MMIKMMTAAVASMISTGFSAEASTSSKSFYHHETPKDTTISNTRKIIVESFGELSKTVNKLSETALKLLEAQEELEKKEAVNSDSNGNGVYLGNDAADTQTNGLFLGDEPQESQTERDFHEDFSGNGVYLDDDPRDGSDSEAEGSPFDIHSIMDLSPDPGAEGTYMWVPGSKQTAVEAILQGKSVNVPTEEPDLNEMTLWRGDTIPMVIRDRKIGRYDRKLYNWLMYPKGTWQGGLTASYGDISTDDSEILSLMTDINVSGHIYSVKPYISYFIRNNLSVGLRMAYSKGHAGIETFNVDIDEDMAFNLHDITYDTESYTAAIFMQQYYGLRRMGRFAIFNEVELAFASGNGDFIRPFNEEMRHTHWTTTSVNLNFSPGVSILIMKNAAFNLSFGVFGFHLKNERQWENDVESGSRLTSGINFRFNIFNINFGVAVTI